MRWLFAAFSSSLLAAAACSAFSGDDPTSDPGTPSGQDGGVAEGGPGIDGGPDAGPAGSCFGKKFGPPAAVAELSVSKVDETDAVMDGTTIVFATQTAATPQTLATQTGSGAPQPLLLVDTGNASFSPTFVPPDRLVLFSIGEDRFLYRSTRSTTGVYSFMTDKTGRQVSSVWATKSSLWTSNGTRISQSILGPDVRPTVQTELPPLAGGNETHAVVSDDELTMYFASDADTADLGGQNIWVATRATAKGTFGKATLVKELSTPSDEYPTWISDDGCEMLLARRSENDWDIYRAGR